MKRWLLLPAVLALTACEGAQIFGNAFWDELRGAPDAEDLVASAHFEGAGIAFDYPAVLHLRGGSDDDGDRSWSLEYGMFELEVRAPYYETTAADSLGVLADLFDGGRSLDAEPPVQGRTLTLCGEEVTSTRIRMKIVGDWSDMEGFDLPAEPGRSRLLIFSDEPVGGEPTPLSRATFERVISTLRCGPDEERNRKRPKRIAGSGSGD
jgi:hypothetical protein